MRTEQKRQKEIITYLKSIGAYTIKTITSNRAGVPDLIVCIDGKFAALEVKRPGNKASPLQMLELTKIAEAGGVSAVVTSVSDVEAVLSGFIVHTNKDEEK